MTANHPSDIRCSDQSGDDFIALSKKIIELCEFFKERRNIHQYVRAMIRGILLAYGKEDEREMKTSSEKVRQLTEVMFKKRGRGETVETATLIERINRPANAKVSTPKKVGQVRRMTEAAGETANPGKGSGSLEKDVAAWRKWRLEKRNIRKR